jgi:hypothetical protein
MPTSTTIRYIEKLSPGLYSEKRNDHRKKVLDHYQKTRRWITTLKCAHPKCKGYDNRGLAIHESLYSCGDLSRSKSIEAWKLVLLSDVNTMPVCNYNCHIQNKPSKEDALLYAISYFSRKVVLEWFKKLDIAINGEVFCPKFPIVKPNDQITQTDINNYLKEF